MKTLTFALAAMIGAPITLAQVAAPPPPPPPPASAASSAQDPAAKLAAARRELALLRARHGSDTHPAVLRQIRVVSELQKKSAPPPDAAGLDKPAQLEAAKTELARLRERYTDEHPLVKNQLKKIAELEKAATP